MAKSLSQRIAERTAKEKRPSKAGLNLAAFLAARPDIVLAMRDSWPLKTIWEQLRLEGKIDFGYDAFLNYVRKTIDSTAATPAPDPATVPAHKVPAAPGQKSEPLKNGKPSAPAHRPAGFQLNPSPNEKDIL